MGISTQLRKYRKRFGKTQKQVAEITGLNEKSISNWERGSAEPDVEIISILCRLYDVSPNELFEWEYQINLSTVSTDEGKIIGMYRELDPEGKGKVADYLHDLIMSGKYKKDYPLGSLEKVAGLK